MSLYKGNSLLAGTNFTSFSFRDEYAETAIYKYLDIVTYEGSSYMALKTVSDVTPSDDRENWIMVAKGYSGEIGSVNVTDTYDLVGEGEGSTVDGQSFLDEVASNIVTLNSNLGQRGFILTEWLTVTYHNESQMRGNYSIDGKDGIIGFSRRTSVFPVFSYNNIGNKCSGIVQINTTDNIVIVSGNGFESSDTLNVLLIHTYTPV